MHPYKCLSMCFTFTRVLEALPRPCLLDRHMRLYTMLAYAGGFR